MVWHTSHPPGLLVLATLADKRGVNGHVPAHDSSARRTHCGFPWTAASLKESCWQQRDVQFSSERGN